MGQVCNNDFITVGVLKMEVSTTYPVPTTAEIADWTKTLDDDAREFFEERAAIIEFDGGYSRMEAEKLAKSFTESYMQKRQK